MCETRYSQGMKFPLQKCKWKIFEVVIINIYMVFRILLCPHFTEQEIETQEKLRALLKVTKQLSGRINVSTQEGRHQSSRSNYYIALPLG